MSDDSLRAQEILDVLLRLAAADLDARVPPPAGESPIDLVAVAVNMLAEELSASMADQRRLRAELEQEVAQRTAEVEKLARAQALVARQTQAIRELSTPVIEIWQGILVLPLIGLIDEERGEQVRAQLLDAIVRTQARAAIIDITGVPTIDTMVAHQLLRLASAARLLGTTSILTGIGPRNAQTLVGLGAEFGGLVTARSLEAGLKTALALLE